MSNVILLTKILLKNAFRGDKKQKVPTMLILALILIPCLGVPIFMGVEYLANSFVEYGINPLSLLSLILPIGFILLIVTSIFSIVSTYYLSSDIDKLIPLPLKPWEIILAKFFSSLPVVYIMLFSLLTPILLGLGVGSNANIIYYIYTLIITIFFPLVPTALISLIITSLMRFSTKTKSKDKFTYVVSIIGILFGFALSFGSNSIVNNIMTNIQQTITTLQDLIDRFGNTMMSVFFILYPTFLALTNSTSIISLLYIILSILISIVCVVIFAILAQKTYFKGILGGKANKRKAREKKVHNDNKIRTPFMSLVLRDIKTIWRSPSYNMNLLLAEILMPVILIISFIISFSQSSEESNEIFKSFIGNMDLKNAFTWGILFLVSAFFSSMSLASPTAISREGKNAGFLKAIPVSATTLIHSKMFFGVVSSIIIYFVMFIAMIFLGFLSFLDFIFLTISVLPFTILMNYIGILLDIWHPKLNWDNENVPVKQNFNAVGFMFMFWIIGGLITFASYYITISGYLLSIIIGVITIIGCLLIFKYIKKKDIELLNKIG